MASTATLEQSSVNCFLFSIFFLVITNCIICPSTIATKFRERNRPKAHEVVIRIIVPVINPARTLMIYPNGSPTTCVYKVYVLHN